MGWEDRFSRLAGGGGGLSRKGRGEGMGERITRYEVGVGGRGREGGVRRERE